MFKNEIAFTQSHPLSKKEKKEIMKSLKTHSGFKEEYVDLMMKSLNDMTIHKGNIQNKKRNVIFEGNNPILFEYDKEFYYPTIYLLQMFNAGIGYNIIKNCALIYDATTEYLINGADLMLKGVVNRKEIKNNEQKFRLNDLFYVQSESGFIVAIGTSLVDKNTMNIDQPSGKFLRIIHKLEDSLYNSGSKKDLKPIVEQIKIENKKDDVKEEEPKEDNNEENKKEESKEGDKKEENKVEDKKEENKEEDKKEENKEEDKKEKEGNGEIKVSNDNINSMNEVENKKEKENEEIKDNENNNEHGENKEDNGESENEEEEKITPKEVDENLDIVFLTLCKLCLQDEKFPMDPGKLYHDFIKPLGKEIKMNVNIKLSSYKKVNEYFKYLSKDKHLISFDKAKGQNNDYITNINFDNELIKTFKPRISKIKFLRKNNSKKNEDSIEDNILLTKDQKIEIQTLFRPNQKLHPLFVKYLPNFDAKKHYDFNTCKNVLISYLKENNLFSKEKNSVVKIDQYLKDLLKIKEDKFYIDGKDYDIAEIIEYFKDQLKSKSCIVKISADGEIEEEIVNSNVSIRIISKKINNKNVTLISGLDYFVDLKEVVKTLAKHFATSVTIKDEISGLKNAVFIQGHWVDELVEKLTNEFKINKSRIKVEDRLKNKKNKKK